MNNNIANDKTDILLYGLRTARQKKRMQYRGFEQKLRALDRERQDLWQKKRNLGWIELNPPVMRGWNRSFVLREDVARSKHAAFFKGMLNKINTTQWSNRKDFKQTRRRYNKDRDVDRLQQLLQPCEHHFKKLAFTEKEQQFFYEKYIYRKWEREKIKVFVFVEPWRFVLRVKPNMVTKTRVRDEAIESRLAEIDKYLVGNNLKPALAKFKGDSYNRKWWKYYEIEKDVYEFKNKSLPQILDAIKED